MRIIFAHPAHSYDSYTDYRRLVELSGFETCRQDEIDVDQDAVYIASPVNRAFWLTMRGKPAPGHRRAKVVYWNLERPDVPTEAMSALPGNAVHASNSSARELVDEIWVSDRGILSYDPGQRFVFLASDPRLAEPEIYAM